MLRKNGTQEARCRLLPLLPADLLSCCCSFSRNSTSKLAAHLPAGADGLRGLAILAVVFTTAILGSRAPGSTTPRVWGWGGVILFFLLSGFLITSILLTTRDSRATSTTFMCGGRCASGRCISCCWWWCT